MSQGFRRELFSQPIFGLSSQSIRRDILGCGLKAFAEIIFSQPIFGFSSQSNRRDIFSQGESRDI